ncbi:hypothetical protein PIB30_080580 [Stylosanthes scabra]|uniref:Uncharacterized protein n=1 Tax=Stylosanthes scabra TaxID=79078 RepID=A0ABU6STP1_9FABA|nr:hypothetical protein [Stylosanthes scabra]
MEQQQQGFTLINEQLASMQIQQQTFFENMQSTQAQYLEELKAVKTRQDELWNNTNRFHHQIRKEQDMLQKEMTEMKRQLKDRTKNASARDPYCCWAHQQANPNLTDVPIHQIPKLMHLNAEKGRHLFYGGLKSHMVAGSPSQAAPSQAPPSDLVDEPMADPKN